MGGLLGLFVGMVAPMPGFVRAASLTSSTASIVLGLMCFRDGFHSVALLGVWIGIGWVMNSVTMLVHGFSTQGQERGWLLVSGFLGFLAGATVLASPVSSLVTLVWLAGIFLLVTGVVEIIRAVQLRRRARSW